MVTQRLILCKQFSHDSRRHGEGNLGRHFHTGFLIQFPWVFMREILIKVMGSIIPIINSYQHPRLH